MLSVQLIICPSITLMYSHRQTTPCEITVITLYYIQFTWSRERKRKIRSWPKFSNITIAIVRLHKHIDDENDDDNGDDGNRSRSLQSPVPNDWRDDCTGRPFCLGRRHVFSTRLDNDYIFTVVMRRTFVTLKIKREPTTNGPGRDVGIIRSFVFRF